ncbi:scarecrow-like protein 14 [Sorghum bicolor]|uniref:scarecrow-like protein 14 n=1 Tax=Sorghum bicolor TaxID=4558 RepID=UPI000B423A05|nr:scarecrow-like protein 14 [Sorghum bicolor]|eukprot:XP_021317849.1 scarecrow-like protein 14 [Sorghum bicolor]
MGTTPEEFFIKDLMEQPPSSPPVFLDLSQKPNVSSEVRHHVPNNDMMLPYISRMLMEDNIDDELTDHPALLQVQQPFAQILSSPSFGTNTNNSEGPNDFLCGGHGDKSAPNSPVSKGTYIVGESLKDLEEANTLLPKDNNIRRNELVNQIRDSNIIDSRVKKRYNNDNLLEEEVRTTNKAVMMINDLEEKGGSKFLDKMMLHAYETCIKGMERVTIDVEKRNRKSRRIKVTRNNGVDIRRLLISCAQALAADDHMTARELLKQIKQHASATGDATQRLAYYFSKGLESRILGTGSQLWQLLMLEYPSVVELLKAYILYSEACCFVNVTFIFSAMTILQAMAGKSRLHIVDYGTRFGFHWAGLLRFIEKVLLEVSSRKGTVIYRKGIIIARRPPPSAQATSRLSVRRGAAVPSLVADLIQQAHHVAAPTSTTMHGRLPDSSSTCSARGPPHAASRSFESQPAAQPPYQLSVALRTMVTSVSSRSTSPSSAPLLGGRPACRPP